VCGHGCRSTALGSVLRPGWAIPLTLYLDPNTVSRFSMFCAAFVGDNLDIDAVDGNVAIIWNDKRNVTTPLTPE